MLGVKPKTSCIHCDNSTNWPLGNQRLRVTAIYALSVTLFIRRTYRRSIWVWYWRLL